MAIPHLTLDHEMCILLQLFDFNEEVNWSNCGGTALSGAFSQVLPCWIITDTNGNKPNRRKDGYDDTTEKS
jgi:hypothetical protein